MPFLAKLFLVYNGYSLSTTHSVCVIFSGCQALIFFCVYIYNKPKYSLCNSFHVGKVFVGKQAVSVQLLSPGTLSYCEVINRGILIGL